jgi:hypothetical protein
MEYANVAKVYIVADRVILDPDMLHLGVEDVVLGEAGSGFVVTIYGGTCATTECKAVTLPRAFMARLERRGVAYLIC